MRYWPFSLLCTSPLMPGDCVAELTALHKTRRLSGRAFEACGFVAGRTEPVIADGLVVLEDENHTTLQFAYMQMPTSEQWRRLERANIIEAPHCHIFIISTLH
jgi:hypothetical protein